MANKTNVLAQYDKQHKKYERFAKEVEHQLRSILEEEGIVCNAITSRVKERDSLDKKIDIKMDKYSDLTEITDIAGIRVITYYDNDVNRVAEIVEREFCVDKDNSIDKRKALDPDKFGYCSVHYVVSMNETRLKLPECKAYAGLKCEIQIRTVLQHAWAEIEHDLGYKSETGVPRNIRRNFSRLAGLLELADKEFQEIRDLLTEYRHDVTSMMEQDAPEVADSELDVVVLEAILNTNPKLQNLNQKISEIAGMEIRESELQEKYVGSLQLLNSLLIQTTLQLNQIIDQNINLALYLAEKILRDRYLAEPEDSSLSRTIGIFYLCYAELLSKHPSIDEIIVYMRTNSIGDSDESVYKFAESLLQYGHEFTSQQ